VTDLILNDDAINEEIFNSFINDIKTYEEIELEKEINKEIENLVKK
jgi:hypothetical protein